MKDPYSSMEDYSIVPCTSSANVQNAKEAKPQWHNMQTHGLTIDTILDEHD